MSVSWQNNTAGEPTVFDVAHHSHNMNSSDKNSRETNSGNKNSRINTEEETSTAPLATIYIVDDDEAIGTALSRLLRAANFEVHSYLSAAEFLLHAPADDKPGCLLLDYQLPGPSGLELQASLVKQQKLIPIIFLSGESDIPTAVQAMVGGAVDFLTKPANKDTLLAAIRKALVKQAQLCATRKKHELWLGCFKSLTPREIEIFRLVIAGKLNKEIAYALEVSERTIKAHRANVMSKMHAGSLAELVKIAGYLGLETAEIAAA